MVQTSIEQLLSAQGTRLLRQQIISNGTGGLVYHLKTSIGERILKMQSKPEFFNVLKAEKIGLQTLKENSRFKIPEVFAQGKIGETDYLLMEFIPNGKPIAHFWEIFAEMLADLHRNSTSYFGFSERNYIGSLPQFNLKENTAAEFYINQRLKPQFKLASENGFSFKNLENVFKNISSEIPEEKPALIHGDLWNGNYLIDEKGFPVLIDPAVCFGPREMDLAMMRLFGGFPEKFFSTYNEIFPLPEGAEKRIKLWQLYYLLVHLNLFGSGYLSEVKEVIYKYQ
ncbi:MAG TPA: fructosamine kinase family protein [Aequorivita sp.]|nr:fructosamine kinase family protein [Aequorivita sp.]